MIPIGEMNHFQLPLSNSWAAMPAELWAYAAAALVLLVSAVWLSARAVRKRRVLALYAALADSVSSRLILRGKLDAHGFVADFEPAPAPFRSLSVRVGLSSGQQALAFLGTLPQAPPSEIMWVRGTPPLNALGAHPGAGVWAMRRLDVAAAEFATRGNNSNAIIHEFQAIMTRFGPSLQRVSVQANHTPHLLVEVMAASLVVNEIGPLVRAVRSLARAAQIA